PDNMNPSLTKLIDILLETSQLEVTIRSPIATVKNQQHAFRRLVVDGLAQQLRQRDGPLVRIGEGEIGCLLSDLWRSSRSRQPRAHDEEHEKKRREQKYSKR